MFIVKDCDKKAILIKITLCFFSLMCIEQILSNQVCLKNSEVYE